MTSDPIFLNETDPILAEYLDQRTVISETVEICIIKGKLYAKAPDVVIVPNEPKEEPKERKPSRGSAWIRWVKSRL